MITFPPQTSVFSSEVMCVKAVKLCAVLTFIELYDLMPVSVTLIRFEEQQRKDENKLCFVNDTFYPVD